MSVEIPSRDKKLIRLAAVERSLPSFLRRGRFSMMHGDNAVGEIVPLLNIDQARLPNDSKLRLMVGEVSGKYGGLPTAIIPVTQAIADVFPKLSRFVGKTAAFAGGTVFEDDRIGKTTREEILAARIDSFSISGASFKTKPITWCDETGCEMVDEVADLDLSMLTLCTSNGQKTAFGQAQAQNHGAAFVVIQQADFKEEDHPRSAGKFVGKEEEKTTHTSPEKKESGFTSEKQGCDCGTVSKVHLEGCSLQGQEVKEGVGGAIARGVGNTYKKGLGLAQADDHEDMEDSAIKDLVEELDKLEKAIADGDQRVIRDSFVLMRHHLEDMEKVQKMEQAECTACKKLMPGCTCKIKAPLLAQAIPTSNMPLVWQGLPLVIENGKGTIRRGTSSDGKPWERMMLAHYGCIKRTESADGDEVDFYLGDNLTSDYVLVINQLKHDGSLDEHKCILGTDNLDAALALYKAHYPPEFVCGPAKSMTVADFKDWLKSADLSKMVQSSIVTFDQLKRIAAGEDTAAVMTSTPGVSNSTFGGNVCPHCSTTGDCDCKANSTASDVKMSSTDGSSGVFMSTTTHPVQATPTTITVEGIGATAVVQADQVTTMTDPEKAKVMEANLHGEDPVQLDMMRRIEHMEQEVALLKGQRTENPIKEDQAMPETAPPTEEPKPDEEKKEEPVEEKPYDIKQAVLDIKQAVLESLPGLVAEAVKNHQPVVQAAEVPAPAPAAPVEVPTPAAAPVKQAKTTVETPVPAAPSPSDRNDPEIERLSQALDHRGPVGFREVLNYARNQKE